MPLLLLLLIAILSGLAAAFLTRLYPQRAVAPPVVEVALEAGRHAAGAAGRRAVRAARLDPEKATGLALTLALVAVLAGGVVLALLAVVVRSTDVLAGIDSSVAEWGDRHATAWSHDGLTLVTNLGETWTVVVVAVAVALVEIARTRSRWVAPFLLAVIAGRQAPHRDGQAARGSRPPGARARGRDARPVVPQRPHLHRRRVMGGLRARRRPLVGPPSLAGARRHRRRHRGRGRGQPRAARRPLADRRARQASHSAGPGSLPARSPSAAASCASAPPRRPPDAAGRRPRRATLPRPAESGRWS